MESRTKAHDSKTFDDFLTSICTTFPLVNSQEKQSLLGDCLRDVLIELSEFDVYKELRKTKTGVSPFPGEIPPKLIHYYTLFLALPLSILINECFVFGVFPSKYKKSYIRVISSPPPPNSCDDLRPISLCPWFAKVTESFILRRLSSQIRESIEKYQ